MLIFKYLGVVIKYTEHGCCVFILHVVLSGSSSSVRSFYPPTYWNMGIKWIPTVFNGTRTILEFVYRIWFEMLFVVGCKCVLVSVKINMEARFLQFYSHIKMKPVTNMSFRRCPEASSVSSTTRDQTANLRRPLCPWAAPITQTFAQLGSIWADPLV